jgi:hypothetical protein
MTVATSKTEALRIGAVFFDNGKGCPKGHGSVRYTRGGRCMVCTKEANAVRLGYQTSGAVRSRRKVCEAAKRAADAGEITYVGTVCPKGHTERWTTSGNCVECGRNAQQRDRDKSRWNRRVKLYGVDEAAFQALRESQGGICPICADPLPGVDRTHIDHCHTTNRVRGLLCGPCNQGIGLLRESEVIMRRAIDYVSAHS